MLEKKDEPFEMTRVQLAVNAVKRMRNRVSDLRRLEIVLQLKNIIPDTFDLAVLLL